MLRSTIAAFAASVLLLLALSFQVGPVSAQSLASGYSQFTQISATVPWLGRTKTGLAFVTKPLNVTINGAATTMPIGPTAVMYAAASGNDVVSKAAQLRTNYLYRARCALT